MEDARIQKGRADAKDVQRRTQRIGQNGRAVCGAHGTKGIRGTDRASQHADVSTIIQGKISSHEEKVIKTGGVVLCSGQGIYRNAGAIGGPAHKFCQVPHVRKLVPKRERQGKGTVQHAKMRTSMDLVRHSAHVAT
jgi:hypothetical protein